MVLFIGCQSKSTRREEYTVLVGSPLEALSFSLPSNIAVQHYQWRVIVDGEGSFEERLKRHSVDFYMVDFFQYYDMYQSDRMHIKNPAVLASYADVSLVVRKNITMEKVENWRLGMTAGSISDYLLDYWFYDEDIQRMQVRDEYQGIQLILDNQLDGMPLSRFYAQVLLDTGDFIELYNSTEDGLPLNVMLTTHDSLDEEEYARVVHDYRVGVDFYRQNTTVLASLHLSEKVKMSLEHRESITPFLMPSVFEELRKWRLMHIPFSRAWSYESMMWTPSRMVY